MSRWVRYTGVGAACFGVGRLYWSSSPPIAQCSARKLDSPSFSLGIIADVQYADAEDGWNFARTTRRAFRGSLNQLERAVDWWNAQELAAVAQLGDARGRARRTTRVPPTL